MNEAQASRFDHIIDSDFCGAVHIALPDRVLYALARGFADRAHNIPNTLDTQFAIASGTKGFTALTVMSLVAQGALSLETKIHSVLRDAGDLLDPATTVRHLLSHTSGIGDYLDESAIGDVEDYVLEVPAHRLASPSDFLPILHGRPMKFQPGSGFSYCNSGYVILALVIETVTGRSYYDVVEEQVFAPAQMQNTAFFRLDELPGRAAIGYLPKRGWRSNHLHLPVRGGGDGGAYSTVTDLARFWTALYAGSIVPSSLVEEMTRPQSDRSPTSHAYGLGFWLANGQNAVFLEGSDPGISFRSTYEPARGLLYTVLSNTTSGAWPVVKGIDAMLGRSSPRENLT